MYDIATDTYYPDPTDTTSGGIDSGGFNPVSDLPSATPISIGSDVYYPNADGTYTGTNTETGTSYSVTPEQMASLQNPQTSGNASMGNLTGAPTLSNSNTPSVFKIKLNSQFLLKSTKN